VLYVFVYGYPESTIGMPETPPAASDAPAPAPTTTP
jgi:hypothetical protein